MIYLASPIFSDAHRAYGARLAQEIEGLGHTVYYPWRDAGDMFYQGLYGLESPAWREAVFRENVEALERATHVVAVLDGADVDSGVAWEVGYARARSKPIHALRTDFRTHSGSALSVNLMLRYSVQQVCELESDLLRRLELLPRPVDRTVDQVEDFYNEIAPEYDSHVQHPRTTYLRARAERLALASLKRIGPPDRLLDIGCGTSQLTDRLEARSGILVDPAYRLTARRVDERRTTVLTARIEELYAPAESFDVVTCLLVLDHVSNVPSVLQKVAGLLRPGGHFVTVYQNSEDEVSHREDPDYFVFEGSDSRVRFRVRSNVKALADLGSMIPQDLRIKDRATEPSEKWRVGALDVVHCTKRGH